MTTDWQYVPGDWYVTCDVCGKQIYASKSKQRWDGLIVCPEDWETRHSLDFIRSRADKISVPFTRPEPPDTFTAEAYCTVEGRGGVVGYAVVGCSVVGLVTT